MVIIINNVKSNLGIHDLNDTSFDQELLTAMTLAVSTLLQLGVTEFENFSFSLDSVYPEIEDPIKKSLIFSYIPLKVRLLFDPPKMGHHLSALKELVENLETRLQVEYSTLSFISTEVEND